MLYLLIVSILWGFSFVLIKGTLVSLDSNLVSFVRMLLSFAVFVPFVRLTGVRMSHRLQLMLIGGVQFGLMYVAYVASYQYLPAHVIVVLTTTTPLFVTIFNDLYARKIHRTFFLAALLAVAGGVVIEFPDQAHKIYPITAMAGPTYSVDDPFGGSLLEYQRMAAELASIIDRGLDRIIQLAEENSTLES